jgi:hypothetical protein
MHGALIIDYRKEDGRFLVSSRYVSISNTRSFSIIDTWNNLRNKEGLEMHLNV